MMSPVPTPIERREALADAVKEAFIRRVFYLDRGWKFHPMLGNQRVTIPELRRLRDRRATHIQVSFRGQFADVEVTKLLSNLSKREARQRWGVDNVETERKAK